MTRAVDAGKTSEERARLFATGLISGLALLAAGAGALALATREDEPVAVSVRTATTARIALVDGLNRDGERLVKLLSEVGVAPALFGWAADDPIAMGLEALDPEARGGEPHLSFGEPREGDKAPQYVLVDSKPVLGVLADCVARQIWCVVQQKGSEEKEVLWSRHELYRQEWNRARQRLTDSQWVAWVGRSIPAGIDAAWVAVSDGQLALGRPSGGDQVHLVSWPGMTAGDFACLLEQTWPYKDEDFKCADGPANPCSPYGGGSYRGPAVPEQVARWIHPAIGEIDLTWDHAELRAISVLLEGELPEADARKLLGLPTLEDPLPDNILSISALQRGGKTRISIRARGLATDHSCPLP